MRVRVLLLSGMLLALFGVVLLRAAKVQLLDRSRLSRLQRDQTRRELEWAPRRGMIVDRRGEALAVTRDVDSVFADPSAFETARSRAAAASRLAAALRIDRARVLEKLAQPDRRFVWIKRRIDEAAAERVRALALDGIELVKEPKRFYPQRQLAGHVLGFVGEESGQEGLERELDGQLRGKSVQVQATRDARGAMVLEHGAPDPPDLTGATVTLTLDSAIQLAAERELAKAVRASRAAGGWAVVLDVRTGAVLALAGNPAFDANKPGPRPDDLARSRRAGPARARVDHQELRGGAGARRGRAAARRAPLLRARPLGGSRAQDPRHPPRRLGDAGDDPARVLEHLRGEDRREAGEAEADRGPARVRLRREDRRSACPARRAARWRIRGGCRRSRC